MQSIFTTHAKAELGSHREQQKAEAVVLQVELMVGPEMQGTATALMILQAELKTSPLESRGASLRFVFYLETKQTGRLESRGASLQKEASSGWKKRTQGVLNLEGQCSVLMHVLHEVQGCRSCVAYTLTNRRPLLSHCCNGRRRQGKRTHSIEMPSVKARPAYEKKTKLRADRNNIAN